MIEFMDVTVKHSDMKGIEDVSFIIEKGHFVYLMGPTGAGKSTIIKSIQGSINIDSGKIIIDGNNISNFSKTDLAYYRREVGIVFQDPEQQLFMPTVYEDVEFGPRNFGFTEQEVEKNVKKALKQVGMYEYKEKAPHHLSFGQKRKVAIARFSNETKYDLKSLDPYHLIFKELLKYF